MAAGSKSLSKTFVWILLGLLIVGLAGFGATNMSGTIRVIGSVGNQSISVDEYARELQRELRALEAQTGGPVPMSQVSALGLDQAVLSRLVLLAALDNEVAELGLSIGDANLQQDIMGIPAFQGMNGGFDRETYRFALSQAGISETEFEEDLRAEAARTLVQGAIVSGVRMPDVLGDTLVGFIAERRSFTWAPVTAGDLQETLPDPTPGDLRAYYDANPDEFTLPETKRLTYVQLSPEMILDQVEIDDAALRQLFEQRGDEYNIPERRLVERLIFADEASATEALARIASGETTFEALVQGRGLALADVDMGDVTVDDLDEAAGPVFAAGVGDVVGPLASGLGPALFRVNGILAARSTDFEDVRAELRDELAGQRARRLIAARAEEIDDLLAAGATLAELADETEMELGRIDWDSTTDTGIAAFNEFREAAAAVTERDFPAVDFLEDGSLFAIQLDELLPPRPEPFEAARDRVIAAWKRAQTETALRGKAETVIAALAGSGDFTETGLTFRVENGLTRTAYIDGTPANFMNEVFAMEPGEYRIVSGDGAVLIVRLDAVLEPDETPELSNLRRSLNEELSQNLSQALFEVFIDDTRTRATARIDQRALNAVHASFQ